MDLKSLKTVIRISTEMVNCYTRIVQYGLLRENMQNIRLEISNSLEF